MGKKDQNYGGGSFTVRPAADKVQIGGAGGPGHAQSDDAGGEGGPVDWSYRMPGNDLAIWQVRMGLSDRAAAELLEISRTTWTKYKAEGAPKVIALACAAIIRGIEPWPN